MKKASVRCAVVQLCSTEDIDHNLERSAHWIERAVQDGAELIALPENFAWLRIQPESPTPVQTLDGPVVEAIKVLAQRHRVHILMGSIPEASGHPKRHHNTSAWIDPEGRVLAAYRKQHLFDIELKGQESHRESAHVLAGGDDVVVETDVGVIGLSICYDLRFPELYRRLVDKGAMALAVPAAFTLSTGKDHWHVLLRARAIENQCYVIAPGQWGHHGGLRRSYGHSVVIDPWGTVVADVSDGEGFAVARLDWDRVQQVRDQLPALTHRRRDLC